MVVFRTWISTPKLQSTLKMRNRWDNSARVKPVLVLLTGCSKPTTKDQILNAEILQALNMVDKNHSFSSANGDSDRFKKMFPDSQIAAKYSQEEKNPNMFFNLVSLHTPLNSAKLQIPKWKSSMTDTPVFSQRNYAKL